LSLIIEREIAKYPFMTEAVSIVDSLELNLEDLSDPNHVKLLDRAAERVKESIIQGEVSVNLIDSMTELLSFPIAIMYVTLLGEPYLERRYALGEAVRVYKLLREERIDKIHHLAVTEFGWDIQRIDRMIDGIPYDFLIHFRDYLCTSTGFHEDKWKLVNRAITRGYVYITRIEASRLLQIEVEKLIREQVSQRVRISLPEELQKRLDSIEEVYLENRGSLGGEGLPKEVISEAFPPCIRHCMEGLLSGRRASHMERFALTSFLVNVGMDLDDMVDLYTSVTDFDESLTRYQIEHIAGLRGSQTRYTPPTCSTLRTHGICGDKEPLCDRVNHPLGFYRIKSKAITMNESRESEADQE
jgi:DNA primase large subunit